jgi:uncharacterized membrane protein YphA (DoxX/SURF4 family)
MNLETHSGTGSGADAGQGKSKATGVCTLLARWVLGALFVYMGLNKALHPVEFLKLLRQYNMVESSLALNAIALGLPWFEVFCGLLLLAGIASRGTALLLALMLAAFTCAVFRRALGIHALQHIAFCAIKFDCGCGAGEEFICRKVVENLGLMILSAWILLGWGTTRRT